MTVATKDRDILLSKDRILRHVHAKDCRTVYANTGTKICVPKNLHIIDYGADRVHRRASMIHVEVDRIPHGGVQRPGGALTYHPRTAQSDVGRIVVDHDLRM